MAPLLLRHRDKVAGIEAKTIVGDLRSRLRTSEDAEVFRCFLSNDIARPGAARQRETAAGKTRPQEDEGGSSRLRDDN